ncbi:MAG: protein-L-isoaspartate O-methyltransferase [Pseudomonadota bacterium]|nr:protein-L-isoaspartate O-methyltransferase [Pseudomonadota bacterium]
MSMTPTALARFNMIEQQIRTWDVLDERVLTVMSDIPREAFTPEPYRGVAYADSQIPIGHGHVMEEPKLVGRILQEVDVHRHDRVLDVGTGTGYLAACLSRLGREIDTVDIHADFSNRAKAALQEMDITNVRFSVADAGHGLPETEQRYDVIIVTGSLPQLHQGFHRSLTIGGRLFLTHGTSPVMEALLVTRVGVGQWRTESLFETYLPPLENTETPPEFSF